MIEQNIRVIDVFYDNPEAIRKFALLQNFNIEGNYPGKRTVPFTEGGLREHLEKLMNIKINEEKWNKGNYTGTYQYVPKDVPTWVHSDRHNDWSCIVYLHPDPAPNSGTSFYKHKSTGSTKYSDGTWGNALESDGDKWDKWEKTDTVGNVFNRAIIFKGELWHAADEYFGSNKHDARLFQTFFFDEVR